jgi:hypothetical protein
LSLASFRVTDSDKDDSTSICPEGTVTVTDATGAGGVGGGAGGGGETTGPVLSPPPHERITIPIMEVIASRAARLNENCPGLCIAAPWFRDGDSCGATWYDFQGQRDIRDMTYAGAFICFASRIASDAAKTCS